MTPRDLGNDSICRCGIAMSTGEIIASVDIAMRDFGATLYCGNLEITASPTSQRRRLTFAVDLKLQRYDSSQGMTAENKSGIHRS